jgi:hypothetical protein
MEVLFVFLSRIPERTKNEFCWIVCKNGTLIYFARSSFFGLRELARQKNELFFKKWNFFLSRNCFWYYEFIWQKNSQYSKKTPWILFLNYYYYFQKVHFLNVDTIIGGHSELKVMELLIKPNLIWNFKKIGTKNKFHI